MKLSWGRSVCGFVLWSLVFGIAHTQAPLYYSNQNQYFLHGLAEAGEGDLRDDWLANTKDPTPLFSRMVAFTATYLHEWFFYGYYLAILGLYFISLVSLFPLLTPANISRPTWFLFIALFVVVHAGIFRLASARLVGVDYPWFLQAGVAGQYVLGFGLQPSVAGVFLITSMAAFLHNRPWQAIIWACLAGVLHATYLPTAALLTLAYMVAQFSSPPYEGGAGGGRYAASGWRRAIVMGLLALVLVMPSVIYNLATFAPASPETFADAQFILAHMRIPHHAEVARWFDWIACLQILWIVWAMFLIRRSLMMLIMLVPFLGALLFTVVQLATGNDTLALLFPWRTSVILVPIATTVVLIKFVELLDPWVRNCPRFTFGLSGLAIGGCVIGGLAITYYGLGYQSNPDEVPLVEFVRTHRRPGDVYLIPVEIAKGKPGVRGVTNSNFRPAPTRGKAGEFIAVDLQGFRLTTGAPVYVDFKSIPYQDREVLEWYERVGWCIRVYGERSTSVDLLRAGLRDRGITHVVVPSAKGMPFAKLGEPVYRDDFYSLFAVGKN